jgi:hypothetical protein
VLGSDLSSGSGAPGGDAAAGRDPDAMIARGQALVDTRRPEGGHSLEWHVQAMFMGDFSAIVVAAARESRSGTGGAG